MNNRTPVKRTLYPFYIYIEELTENTKFITYQQAPTNALELGDAISWEFFKQWVLFGQGQDKVLPGQN